MERPPVTHQLQAADPLPEVVQVARFTLLAIVDDVNTCIDLLANDLGHRVVANKVFEILASNCSGLARETQELEKEIPPWRDESTLRAN